MIYGYARVSTPKQKLARQVDNIKRIYPDAEIISDEYTGTTTDRPGWNRLFGKLKPGDVVVFDEVSRMARNAEQGVELYKKLYDKGIEIKFLKEPHINSEVYRRAQGHRIDVFDNVSVDSKAVENYVKGQGELLNGLLLALAWEQIELAFKAAQQEIEYLHQRTAEGVRKAIERYEREEAEGRPHEKNKPGNGNRPTWTGKKSVDGKKKILAWSRDFNGSMTDAEVMKAIPLARNTYYKYKRELLAELKPTTSTTTTSTAPDLATIKAEITKLTAQRDEARKAGDEATARWYAERAEGLKEKAREIEWANH